MKEDPGGTEDWRETLLMWSSHEFTLWEFPSGRSVKRFWSDILAYIVRTNVLRRSLRKHRQRNNTDRSMSFTKYCLFCWLIIWRSPVTPNRSPLHHCHLKVCPPDKRQVDTKWYKSFTVIWHAAKLNLYHTQQLQPSSVRARLFLLQLPVSVACLISFHWKGTSARNLWVEVPPSSHQAKQYNKEYLYNHNQIVDDVPKRVTQ